MPLQDANTTKNHAIPQNIMGVEFKIIGDLTLRQFTYLAVFGITGYIIIQSELGILKWPLGLFFGLLGLSLAFVPIADRGMDVWIVNFIKSIFKPTQLVWSKSAVLPPVFVYESVNILKQELITLAPTSSRRKLEEYLDYAVANKEYDPLDIPEEEYIKKVRENFTNIPYQESASEVTPLSDITIQQPIQSTTLQEGIISNVPQEEIESKNIQDHSLVSDLTQNIKSVGSNIISKLDHKEKIKDQAVVEQPFVEQDQTQMVQPQEQPLVEQQQETQMVQPQEQPLVEQKQETQMVQLQEQPLVEQQQETQMVQPQEQPLVEQQQETQMLQPQEQPLVEQQQETQMVQPQEQPLVEQQQETQMVQPQEQPQKENLVEKIVQQQTADQEKDLMLDQKVQQPSAKIIKSKIPTASNTNKRYVSQSKSKSNKLDGSNLALNPITPDRHSGRVFTSFIPSRGELVLPIRGERVLSTSNEENLRIEKDVQEKTQKLQDLIYNIRSKDNNIDLRDNVIEKETKPTIAQPTQNYPINVVQESDQLDKSVSLKDPTIDRPNTIQGQLKDNLGKAIPDSIIIIKNSKNEPIRAIKTNKIGQFVLSTPLENGSYFVEVSKSSTKGLKFDTISVNASGNVLPFIELQGT